MLSGDGAVRQALMLTGLLLDPFALTGVLSQISAGYAIAFTRSMLRGGIVVQRTPLRALVDPAARAVVPCLSLEPSRSRRNAR